MYFTGNDSEEPEATVMWLSCGHVGVKPLGSNRSDPVYCFRKAMRLSVPFFTLAKLTPITAACQDILEFCVRELDN